MRKNATITSLFAVLCVLLVLAACGKGNSGNADNGGETATNTPTSGGTAAASNDKEFTIRVGSWFLDDRPYQQAYMKAVEAGYKKLYPKAKIQWDITLGATFFDKLKAQFASDSAPDVTFFQKKDWFKAGNFMDLSNEPWVSRLSETGKKSPAVLYEGKILGVPLGSTPAGGVWYNADMFNELGLKPPKTVQEFMDVCEKLKAAGKTPIALGFKDVWTAQLFMSLWIQSYGFASDSEYGKKMYNGVIKSDDPAIQAVYRNLQTMKEKGYFNKNALSIDWPASAQLLASGEAGMIVQGPYMPGTNKDNIEKGGYKPFQLGYFPLMDDKGNTQVPVGTNASLAINAKTKLVEESKALVNLMTKQEILAPWLAGEGSLPYFTDVQVKFDYPVMDTLKQFVDKSSFSNRFEDFIPASATTAMRDLVTKVISGAPFNPSDLKAAQDAFEKDKATVVLPY
ncbi:ABC transporter substrate-binding protein [Paenibacillus sp. HJGM_3]|uniref:ABC transporter substrate-binding protein n=1 Tax=Paenibacillus sp. HJGM_3 TaxID=3379816 RepID=UPI00385CA4D4